MRVVAGKHRGRHLLAPEGSATRPTSDRARQALFDILMHRAETRAAIVGGRVLDAFAGTGALGIEALSRGAEQAIFMENAPRALAALRRNLTSLGESAAAAVTQADATDPPRAEEFATAIFLDPPYGAGSIVPAIGALHRQGWIGPKTILVVESGGAEEIALPPSFETLDERRYGAARIRIGRWREN